MVLTQNSGAIIGPVARLLGMVMNGIFYVLNQIGIPNTGLAIIIMTILIYMALLPLTIRQQKFSKLSRKMQPEINKIQKKYAGRRDQTSQMRMNEEIQAVYKKYGVNATGSCIQLLIQMPILLGMYRVFYNIPAYVPMVKEAFFPLVDNLIKVDPAGEYLQTFSAANQFARQFENESFTTGVTTYVQNTFIDVLNKFSTADWGTLGEHFSNLQSDISNTVSKLSQYNSFLGLNISNSPSSMLQSAMSSGKYYMIIIALLIPFLAAFTQWLNVKLMPTGNENSKDQASTMMKSMNIYMPIMSAVFCFTLPSGMGIYWIAGAVIRSVQQVLINKHIDKMDIDAMIEKNVEKNKAKEEKSAPRRSNSAGSISTSAGMRGRGSVRNDKYATKLSQEKEDQVAAMRESRRNMNFKPDSLSARVKLVDDYNDSGKR